MPLLFVAVVGACLFGAMAKSHGLFRELEALERGLLALDNASIVLGRSARATFNALVDFNDWVRGAEALHHAAHLCARVPGASAACVSADIAWEKSLAVAHRLAGSRARMTWNAGRAASLAAAGTLGTRVSVTRLADPPVRPVHCPVCGLAVSWEAVSPPPEIVSARVHKRSFRNEVKSGGPGTLQGSAKWNYRVKDRSDGP